MEDVVGAHRLGNLATSLGLAASYETVPIGGEIDLARPNLVVICGPRLSRRTAAVLDQDPHLRFVETVDGVWTIHDANTGHTYRSGLDQTPVQPRDVAYLGRLPRPDGNGPVMIFTGIHPQGSLGVVHLLLEQISFLHAQVQDRYFSTLLATDHHPDTSEPLHVEQLTPFYWQKEQPI
jgi:hypothetical protein